MWYCIFESIVERHVQYSVTWIVTMCSGSSVDQAAVCLCVNTVMSLFMFVYVFNSLITIITLACVLTINY